MSYKWKTCPLEIKLFVEEFKNSIKNILNDNYVGFYLHGSLAMGGYSPSRSDLDILVVTYTTLTEENHRCLARLLIEKSNKPTPIEISILSVHQLNQWRHPSPFEFHYSEDWRGEFESMFLNNNSFIPSNEKVTTDPDLSAHITVTIHRGVCLDGEPIEDVFPIIPERDYISAIMGGL
ncbi:nucleotidyltransferase domain-containing protein [Halalkalibacillus halophilus]|uniref:nucleotidyltransferase domain-containing protein n=1 Tax=Halalkalibacillus halophilus TaxID=392827 RepID=UPI0003FF3276|nr:nucleotidyltransferase domain-containing protein [Halalkalibacillus halophilus]